MLDTCTGSGGTLTVGTRPADRIGLPAPSTPLTMEAVARMVGGTRGRRHFEDSLGTCIFTTRTSLAISAGC